VTEAVYVGGVGARFEREGRMENQEMFISKKQNTPGRFLAQLNFSDP